MDWSDLDSHGTPFAVREEAWIISDQILVA
jgi:hypothetical protein